MSSAVVDRAPVQKMISLTMALKPQLDLLTSAAPVGTLAREVKVPAGRGFGTAGFCCPENP